MIKYEKSKHLAYVIDWLVLRGLDPAVSYDLAEVGWVAYGTDYPVAIGFLRRMEGGHAMIDGLVTNPKATRAERNDGINDVILFLIDTAKTLGFKKLLAYSVDDGIINRSGIYGFTRLPHTLIGMDLGE